MNTFENNLMWEVCVTFRTMFGKARYRCGFIPPIPAATDTAFHASVKGVKRDGSKITSSQTYIHFVLVV